MNEIKRSNKILKPHNSIQKFSDRTEELLIFRQKEWLRDHQKNPEEKFQIPGNNLISKTMVKFLGCYSSFAVLFNLRVHLAQNKSRNA